MTNYKEIIIEWLVQNEAVAFDIVQKSNLIIKGSEPIFIEEARDQEFEENKRLIMNEISKSVGVNPEHFNNEVEDSALRTYFERLK